MVEDRKCRCNDQLIAMNPARTGKVSQAVGCLDFLTKIKDAVIEG
jgi:hypothetical protein